MYTFQDSFFPNKRNTYGRIFKTHILGKPTIRISGGENVYKILHSEHKLVETQWPSSASQIFGQGSLAMSGGKIHSKRKRVIGRAFSFSALEGYIPDMQSLLKSHIGKWCKRGHVLGYIEAKDLTLTITSKVLLGVDLNGKERGAFLTAYNNFSANLFSLPINIPGSGLYRVSIRRVAVLIKVYQLNLIVLRHWFVISPS